jgi:cell division transport system permease protein
VRYSKTRKKLGNFPSVGDVTSITFALFLTGLFGLITIYSQELERIVRENIELQIYLKHNLTETQRTQIEKKIEQLPYVNKDVTKPLTFISKEQAAKDFIKKTGEDFIEFLGENPLHDAYVLKVHPNYHSSQSLDSISTELKKMNGIFQVEYVPDLIDKINKNSGQIRLVLIGIILFLLIVVVALINSTLRLALFSQRFLIRSMQLVGARKWFIQRPFLVRAAFYGILAGMLAASAIWLGTNYANRYIEDLHLIQNKDKMIVLSISLILVGMIVAVTSSYFAIRKYLKMSLDELY